ncbi:MAG TPA: DUF3047 domain-containing protein [Candidatus Binatia bacterium]|jgi:hypothetical protein|nr:DUF3047 domain-containing protein [Candidatus Binatia bacterium]
MRYKSKRSIRARLASLALAFAVVGAAWATERVVVENWRSYPLGTRGIPGDWKEQTWGKPVYDLEIVSDNGQPVLRLRSKGDNSTISRDLKGSVDLNETPILEWRWKVMTLPTGGNACQKSTDDQAAQVYVAWLRSPESVRSRIIGYVWDSTAPAGTICKSQKTSTVTYVVLRSGSDELGKRITERRNVVEDFRRIYREAPDNPSAVSLAIDSDDTRSSAESFIGPTVFKRP